MSFDPSNSAIKVDRTIEEKINACQSQAEVQELLRQAAIDQNLVIRDWDPNILTAVEQPAPKRFAKTEIVAGKKMVFEGDSEIEVERLIGAAYKTAAALQPATTQQTEQPRNERGQFVAAEQTVSEETKAQLQLQMQLGQIDIATYLEKSGAVSEYLEKAGIPVEALRAQVADKQSQRTEQSWAQATEEFLQSSVGADWPGGENMNILGRLVQENNLQDQPSVETLAAVWAHMKQNNMAVENPEVAAREKLGEASQRISEATNVEQIRKALGRSSSMFGR